MIRLTFFTVLFSLATAPAFAHEGAGIAHFLTQADHVVGLAAVIALPVLFWVVLRHKRPEPQKRRIRKN